MSCVGRPKTKKVQYSGQNLFLYCSTDHKAYRKIKRRRLDSQINVHNIVMESNMETRELHSESTVSRFRYAFTTMYFNLKYTSNCLYFNSVLVKGLLRISVFLIL